MLWLFKVQQALKPKLIVVQKHLASHTIVLWNIHVHVLYIFITMNMGTVVYF